MKRWICVVLIALMGLIIYCDNFVGKEHETAIRDLENGTYVMKEKVTVNQESLVKGQKIKLKVTWGKDWVRVRGYPADVDPLQTKQVLILYLFENEFAKEKFSINHFMEKLHRVAVPLNK